MAPWPRSASPPPTRPPATSRRRSPSSRRSVNEGNRFQTLLGATGTGKTAAMAWIVEQVQRPVLVIAHNKTLAAQLCNEFREFLPTTAVEYFVSYYDYYQPEAYVPQADLYIEKDASVNDDIDRLRHAATSALLTRRDVLIVASVSCIYGIGSPKEYEEKTVLLAKGQEIDRDVLLRKLVDIQYSRNDSFLGRGRFRVRGDVVEVQPAGDGVGVPHLDVRRRGGADHATSTRSRARSMRSSSTWRSSRPRST